jgi:proliferating cell nuclear antigen
MYVIYFKTIQSSAFKSLFDGLKELFSDVNIEFTPKGMRLMSIDESHSVLVHLKLDGDNFTDYKCTRDRFVIGVSVPNLNQIMRSITPDDVLSWYVVENDGDNSESYKLGIKFENSEINQTNDYDISLLDVNEDEIIIPDHEYPYELNMPSSDFQKICRDTKNLKPKDIDIMVHGEQLIFRAHGEFATQTITRSVSSSSLQVSKNNKVDEIFQAKFNLDKLIDFTKFTNLGGRTSNMIMRLKSDFPGIWKYPVADLGELTLCLAPLMRED